jgi:hypothetical protein
MRKASGLIMEIWVFLGIIPKSERIIFNDPITTGILIAMKKPGKLF